MLPPHTVNRDPLALALVRKARDGGPGTFEASELAAGADWRVVDIVCTSGPGDYPFEEAHETVSISLVRSGTFVYRSRRGSSLMSPGAILLGSAGQSYECSHDHGEGDRCLSFQFDPDFFARLAHDAGASRPAFDHYRVPPLRILAPLAARAIADGTADSLEEIALELAGAVIKVASGLRHDSPAVISRDRARITSVLRQLESSIAQSHTLADLARSAGLSRYHFPAHVQSGDRGHAASMAPACAPARRGISPDHDRRSNHGNRAGRGFRGFIELYPQFSRRVRRLASQVPPRSFAALGMTE